MTEIKFQKDQHAGRSRRRSPFSLHLHAATRSLWPVSLESSSPCVCGTMINARSAMLLHCLIYIHPATQAVKRTHDSLCSLQKFIDRMNSSVSSSSSLIIMCRHVPRVFKASGQTTQNQRCVPCAFVWVRAHVCGKGTSSKHVCARA